MTSQNVDSRLLHGERLEARQAGVNAAFAAHLGVDPARLHINTAANVRHITPRGVFGFMEVTIEWTAQDDPMWHWRSYRFNGENPVDLSQDELTVLGKFACDRDTVVKDFSRDFFGRLITAPEAPILEMPLPVTEPTHASHATAEQATAA
jgi:hypothetical protein